MAGSISVYKESLSARKISLFQIYILDTLDTLMIQFISRADYSKVNKETMEVDAAYICKATINYYISLFRISPLKIVFIGSCCSIWHVYFCE